MALEGYLTFRRSDMVSELRLIIGGLPLQDLICTPKRTSILPAATMRVNQALEEYGTPKKNVQVVSADGMPPTPPQGIYRLISHHGTLLFFDTKARRLRHGPLGMVPQNLVLDIIGDRCRLLCIGSDPAQCHQLQLVSPQGFVEVIEEQSASFDVHLHKISDNVIAMSFRKKFLSSDLDGLVMNDRGWCREHERYRRSRTLRPSRHRRLPPLSRPRSLACARQGRLFSDARWRLAMSSWPLPCSRVYGMR